MYNHDALIQTDLRHVWHPCSQMKDFEKYPPLIVESASGSYIHTNQGTLIDAISSWWCKSLGHGHPVVMSAIYEQLSRFEHVIGANTTHPVLVRLAEKLARLTGLQHAFFASDGSSAVEIALKMALQAAMIRGESQRTKFIALSGGYHGETLGAMTVSDCADFASPWRPVGSPCHFVDPLPLVTGVGDPLMTDCASWNAHAAQQLQKHAGTCAAIIVEPLIQGAAGMRCYSADFLRWLADFARQSGILLIADEIMTGIGRTGTWLACEHADVRPDLVCLSKGLTSGTMPFSCVLASDAVYTLFYDDFDAGKAFWHSHTYSAFAPGAAAALATLEFMESESIPEMARTLGDAMREIFGEVLQVTDALVNFRSFGAMVAADLDAPTSHRAGFVLAHEAISRGALLRPVGNTIYWLPPLNTNRECIEKLAEITLNSIRAIQAKGFLQ